MGEMQMIGGYSLSILAGKVCSCNAAQFALMPDVVGKSVTFISGQHLQYISDTLQGLLIHANGCVNSCNDFAFIKHSFIMLPGHDAYQILHLRAFFPSYFRQPRIAKPLGIPCSFLSVHPFRCLLKRRLFPLLICFMSLVYASAPRHFSKTFHTQVRWNVQNRGWE